MKPVVIASVLSLALGLLLGRTIFVPQPETDPQAENQSERKVRSVSQRRQRADRDINARTDLHFPDFDGMSEERHALFSAKLEGRLASLSLDEIPDALEFLLAKERKEADDEVPRGISKEMLILLARWYELEGETVLDWIGQSSEWDKSSIFKAKMLSVLGSFQENPERGFALMLELRRQAETVAQPDDDPFAPDDPFSSERVDHTDFDRDLLYEIGRWGSDPGGMLDLLDPEGEYREVFESPSTPADFGVSGGLAGQGQDHRFPVTPGSPHSCSSNPEMGALARGLIDSGRHDLARQLLNDLEGGARMEFQRVIGENAAQAGWSELKRQIDAGVLDLASPFASQVLSELARTDRRGALDWYLSLPLVEGVDRERQLAQATDTFRFEAPESDDPFAAETTVDYSAAIDWLNDLESQGEPVDRAFSALRHDARYHRDWDVYRQLHQQLPPAERVAAEESLVQGACDVVTIDFNGEQLSRARGGHSNDSMAAEALGLMDQVHARSAEINANYRASLRAILERLEDEAAQ